MSPAFAAEEVHETLANTDSAVLDKNLDRIASLQCTDEGLFVLAVHSFVEGWIRDRFSLGIDLEVTFRMAMERFIGYAKSKNGGYVQGIAPMNAMIQLHYVTNGVRHRFAALSRRDAEVATEQLVRFCNLANIGSPEKLGNIQRYLAFWDERKPAAALIEENKRLVALRGDDAHAIRKLTDRLEEKTKIEMQAAGFEQVIRDKDGKIEELRRMVGAKDSKVDAVRKERAEAEEALREAKRLLEGYKKEGEYVELVRGMTAYTRTRADYEQRITRLTAEQKKVLERISLNEDFLIKGSAGTGKTLVLLKAIEKAKSGVSGQDNLGIPEIQGTVVLVTYTNTLVKYDQYVASLLSGLPGGSRVSTADSFLLERLRDIDGSIGIDYYLAEELAKQFPVAGLSSKDMAFEIEGFIWGNDISYQEYVVEGIDRRGMKRPLQKEQRQAIWKVAEAMEQSMEARKLYSRNRAALLLARTVADGKGPNLKKTDFVFIDEAQDLPAAVLKALKACAIRSVILAGDADQSIYQPGFSFRRANLDIQGRTRILHTNFRNTVQLHEIAERYRLTCDGGDAENTPEAFREGPMPELFEGVDLEDMLSLLIKRIALFLNTLEYSSENLCVVVPRDEDVQIVSARLSDEGLSVVDIRERGFDFQEQGSIRVTTMHSAKGLDFPVVLLFLPSFHVLSNTLDVVASERMSRNLIYVAMTRAMDHLNVFLKEGTENPALTDLAKCFEETALGASSNEGQP